MMYFFSYQTESQKRKRVPPEELLEETFPPSKKKHVAHQEPHEKLPEELTTPPSVVKSRIPKRVPPKQFRKKRRTG